MQRQQHPFPLWILLAWLVGAWSVGAASKPLLVYYMPWFVGKPHSEQWGWHWTMDHFNPDVIEASGARQIASWYRPLIGPYDSADPLVLEYHVLLMKLGGIDGVIVDWYGADDYLDYAANNARTAAIFHQVSRAGLTFALCYEDQTIQHQVDGGFLSPSNAVRQAQQTLLYAQSNYFGAPSYLRWDSRPVLLNFGPQYFQNNDDWEEIFSVIDPAHRPAFFTEDNRLPVGVGAFNWPPMWLSLSPGTRGVLSMAALENYLDRFEAAGREWPAYISSAFPRFHDIYQSAGMRDYWGYLGDRKGETFRTTLTRALTNDSWMVQVVTWNDFGEGTMIEPTVEYGYRDLGILQDYRRQYLDPGFQWTTNDLTLAHRFYQMRRVAEDNSSWSAELDEAFAEIIRGDLAAARRRLADLESTAAISSNDAITGETGHR